MNGSRRFALIRHDDDVDDDDDGDSDDGVSDDDDALVSSSLSERQMDTHRVRVRAGGRKRDGQRERGGGRERERVTSSQCQLVTATKPTNTTRKNNRPHAHTFTQTTVFDFSVYKYISVVTIIIFRNPFIRVSDSLSVYKSVTTVLEYSDMRMCDDLTCHMHPGHTYCCF